MEYTLKNGKIFCTPDVKSLNNSGVYKVTFSNGCFYFGSSGNFKKRFNIFRGQFNGTTRVDNKNMLTVMKSCKVAFFEIVSILNDMSVYKDKETELIKGDYENPLMLNRSFSDVNTGVKWTAAEKRKTSITISAKIKSGQMNRKWKDGRKASSRFMENVSKKVKMTDTYGETIMEFKSLKSAGKYIGVTPHTIVNQIKGRNKSIKIPAGYMFRYA